MMKIQEWTSGVSTAPWETTHPTYFWSSELTRASKMSRRWPSCSIMASGVGGRTEHIYVREEFRKSPGQVNLCVSI